MLLQTGGDGAGDRIFVPTPHGHAHPRLHPRRPKRLARRLAREARILAPFAAVAVETLTLALVIVLAERVAEAPVDYWPTTSISSTSNVSAAPPRIIGGEPLSP